jgi:hypothetical protein
VVRCFHRGNGGTKLTGTTFVADGGFTTDLSVFTGFVSAGLILRSGLIRGIGLVCYFVVAGKVGGKVFFHGGEHGVRHAVEVAEAVVNRFAREGVAVRFTGDEAAPHGDRRDGVQGVIAIVLGDRAPDAVVLIPVFRGLPIDGGVIAAFEERELGFNAAVAVIGLGIHNWIWNGESSPRMKRRVEEFTNRQSCVGFNATLKPEMQKP